MHTHKRGLVLRTALGLLSAGLLLVACGKDMNIESTAAHDSGDFYAMVAMHGWSNGYARSAVDERRPNSDVALLIEVKRSLEAEPGLKPYELDAGVLNGVVTLYGEVDTFERRALAERIARAVRGVEEVQSGIVVTQRV